MNIDAIRKMLSTSRVEDLLHLLEGESKFSSDAIENQAITEEQLVLRSLALEHVRFVAKFGLDLDRVIEGGKVFCSRSNEFESWLAIGAPGIEPCELEAYMNENPLKE